ncbi:MAG: hypothetical protein O3C65_02745 [Proteobacteria bacterium]|nr:hypothetical protein [Pseudomonadota bacterium]
MIDELRRLTDDADRARAADPVFLRDLRSLAARYDNPWRQRLVEDDFRDGEFAANPAWLVGTGEFFVSQSGLESRTTAAVAARPNSGSGNTPSTEDVVVGVIANLLTRRLTDDRTPSPQTAPQPASAAQIYLPAKISNPFSITAEIYQRTAGTSLELLVYQGAGRSAGYSLLFEPGKKALLIRRASSGAAVVQESASAVTFTVNTIHALEWTRNADGFMTVRLDGNPVMETLDRGFRHPFDGFSLINRGGEYGLASVRIDGTS